MQTNKKALQGIDTVIVRVSDISRSKQWYHEKLGMTAIWEDFNMKLVVLDTGGPTTITLWQTDTKIENDRNTASYPIFKTLNAHLAQQELQSLGVNAGEVIEDNVVKYFFFYDPDGNVLEACHVPE